MQQMREMAAVTLVLCLGGAAFAQDALSPAPFDVASVKSSAHTAGRDADHRISIGAAGLTGRNVTLKHLIAEACDVRPYQVSGGPKWLDESEYDIDAKAGAPAEKEGLRWMLRRLLAERFHVAVHRELKELRVYAMVVDRNGPKIHAGTNGPEGGRRFHGDMGELANLISVQLTIPAIGDPTKPSVASGAPVPVLDRTGLQGIFDLPVDLQPDGQDMFTLWQRVLQSRMGLKLESGRAKVEMVVVDRAEKIPTEN